MLKCFIMNQSMYCLIELTFFLIIYLHANICQQVQDIEFMQIEMQVIEGLKVGNDCLKSMHEVDVLLCLLFFFTLTFCV